MCEEITTHFHLNYTVWTLTCPIISHTNASGQAVVISGGGTFNAHWERRNPWPSLSLSANSTWTDDITATAIHTHLFSSSLFFKLNKKGNNKGNNSLWLISSQIRGVMMVRMGFLSLEDCKSPSRVLIFHINSIRTRFPPKFHRLLLW